MNEQLETWCYGGNSKDFFKAQIDAIHQYNTKMMNRLLLVMTIILGCYVISEVLSTEISARYLTAYFSCFCVLLVMLCVFRINAHKSILFTRVFILLFATVMFAFVFVLGTIFETNSRAILFIVYVLSLPMLLIIPTHHTYVFLTTVTCIFSITSLIVKDAQYSYMDVAHSFTCLILGFFISQHILENRMTLYALNEQLGTRNLRLDRKLQEKEQQLLQSRISILLSQIQPHFLYNTLTAICGLCDENPKEAKKVTADFADYLRHNLDTLNKNSPVPFSDELRHTQVYLNIEKKRFEEKLRFVYNINTKNFSIPSLTIQPLVENAVKHGVLKRKNGGTVTITTIEHAGFYQISISDDGVGFNPSAVISDEREHIGIENVRGRLCSMCAGTLTIESEIGKGTTALINIPKGELTR